MSKNKIIFILIALTFFYGVSFSASGEGTATVIPADFTAGSYLTDGATFQFTVGSSGLAPEGKLAIIVPEGWPDATQYSTITVSGILLDMYSLTTSTGPSTITITVSTVVVPNTVIYVNYRDLQMPYTVKQNIPVTIMSASDSGSSLKNISTLPTININAGPPSWLSFDNWNLTTKLNTAILVKVKLYDNNYNLAAATGTFTIKLAGKLYNTTNYTYDPDAGAQFAGDSGFTSPADLISIPAGQSEASFYYKTSTLGQTIIEFKYWNLVWYYENSTSLWVTVISGGIENAVVYTDAGSKGNTVTITPDGDGIDDRAYIDFTIGSDNASWDVAVGTSPDCTTPIWIYYGYGTPYSGQVSWDGNYSYMDPVKYTWQWGKAAKGTYYVRIQLSGGSIKYEQQLTIKVETQEISGTVTEYGTTNPISDVYVYAYGPSWSSAMTGSDGKYKLSGLRSGTYTISFSKYGYASEQLSNISAGDTDANASLRKPAFLKINVQRGVSATVTDEEAWGSINVYSTDINAYNSYYGSLHFAVDVSTSDNGMWSGDMSTNYTIENSTAEIYQPGKWTIMQVAPGTYTVRVYLANDTSDYPNVVVNTGEVKEISSIYFSLKKSLAGNIILPEPVIESYGKWVSLEAKREGEYWVSAWGWASIPFNATSTTYKISGVSSGKYEVKAFVQGYTKGKSTVTVSATDDITPVPDITLTTGGGLSGTITVIGDTGDPALLQSYPFNNMYYYNNQFPIWLNAWSPENYSYGWTEIKLSTNATQTSSTYTITGLDDGTYWVSCWLNGFELENSIGWGGLSAKVTSGSGSLNVTLKRYSGTINVKCIVPNNDYGNVTISINGPSLWLSEKNITISSETGGSWDGTTGTFTSPKVGTGFYQVTAKYSVSGIEKSKSIMTTNGAASNVTLDLSGDTYYISGKVEISKTNPPDAPFNEISTIVSSAALYNYDYDYLTMTSTTAFRITAQPYSLSTIAGTSTSGDIKGAMYGTYGNYKSGIINPDGSFRIIGLVPGVYKLKFPSGYKAGLELDGNYSNGDELIGQSKIIYLSSNVENEVIEIFGGYEVSGKVNLPDSDSAVTRDFYMNVSDSNNNYITYTNVKLNNSKSGNYSFKHLPPGEYILSLTDWGYWDSTRYLWMPRQYASSSIKVKVESSDVSGKDIQLSKGGTIKFKLKDGSSGAVITPANRGQILPSSFMIYALANPWVEGGWGWLEYISGTGSTSQNEYFEIKYMPKGTYDLFLGQSSYGFGGYSSTGESGANLANYAAQTVSGIKLDENQVADLGTIEIKQGLSINGTVKDINGTGIPNIPVVANPSLSNEWQSELRGFTDINGKYNIAGLNPDNEYYDIIACPRIDFGGFYFFGSGGIQYGEKVKSMVKIATPTPNVDFVLEKAEGSLTGKVVTEDGEKLKNPFDNNVPTAKIFLQLENTIPRTNPIGDIIADTEYNGSFTIEALAPGTYNLMVLCGGYASASKSVTIGKTVTDAGTITLKRGAKLSGNITKLDGSNPSTTEVRSITAASADLSEILIGSLKKTGEKVVSGYEINGFQKDVLYNIMFLSEEDEMIPASFNFSVAYSSFVNTSYNLTFQHSAPAVFSRAKRDASVFYIYFDLTGSLRKSVPDDSDLTKIITLVTGNGTLANRYIAPNRKILSCTYTPASGETTFSIKLKAYGKVVDPTTGTEFLVDETFNYYTGIGAKNRVKVSNLRGGKITLDGDSSSIQFAPGSISEESGMTYSTTTANIDFARAETLSDLKTSNLSAMSIPRAAAAYPDRTYSAMKLAQDVNINPLSSFYDVLMPAGISRTLKKDATLTLQYSSSADPSTLNVYYYDVDNGVYLLENKNKKTDTDAKTISVSVSHTSVFVVVQSNAQQIVGDSYTGPLYVYNFPNPFGMTVTKDLQSYNPQNLAAGTNMTTEGTYIKYGLPAGIKGEVKIAIYNIVGELVAEIVENVTQDIGKHYFTSWDGKNSSGKAVASGVYIARFTVEGKNEKFFKIAVVR